MDPYLKAIGFNRRVLNSLRRELEDKIIDFPDTRKIYGFEDNKIKIEYRKMFGENIGILLRGAMGVDERISVEDMEAIAVSDYNTYTNNYIVEYAGGKPIILFELDDGGNELVFDLQNKLDFYKDESKFIRHGRSPAISEEKIRLNYAALSLNGTILLPVEKTDEAREKRKEEDKLFKGLMFKYNEGDKEAEEMLINYAEEKGNLIRQRLMEEDFFSVVEGYFLPIEEIDIDYSVLGEILSVDLFENEITKEKIYKLDLDITGIEVQLFINKKDLLGIPMEGMRFMGNCRLTGSIDI